MKKTLIALMALAGGASAAVVGRTETLWTMTFGTDIDGTNDYLCTGSYAPTSVTGVNGQTGDDYVSTTGENDSQATILFEDGTGMSWSEDNWEFEVVFTLPAGFTQLSDWPAIVELTTLKKETNGANYGVRISPYVTVSNELHLDGHLDSNSTTLNSYKLATDKEYIATLSFYDDVLTLKLDGNVVVEATSFSDDLTKLINGKNTADIKQFCLGGRQDGSGEMQVNIHSMSAYKIGVIPEPATATLSLLALAGLAARRRRR